MKYSNLNGKIKESTLASVGFQNYENISNLFFKNYFTENGNLFPQCLKVHKF